MGFESYIARRFLLTKRKARFISIITLISIIGITIGVAALIIVLSVFNGFNTLVTDILVSFDPHLRIESWDGHTIDEYEEILSVIDRDDRILAYSPAVGGRAMMVARNINKIVTVRGIDPLKVGEVSGIEDALVLGSTDFIEEDGVDRLVLGIGLADRLNVMTGDSVFIISPSGMEAALVRFGQPVVRRYVISGIYESMNQEYDSHFAFVSLASAQRLFNLQDKVTGIEIRLHSFRLADRVKSDLQRSLGPTVSVKTWYDLHRDLYSVMEIERWVAYIVLSLIIAVATFNILGSLTMSVIEKNRDIGVLKTMGATNKEIIRIYLFEGLFVGLIGAIVGSVIGYVVCLLQIEYHLFPLDPTVYIIPALPVEIRLMDFLFVGGAALVLAALAGLYPARRAARVLPAEAVRWE